MVEKKNIIIILLIIDFILLVLTYLNCISIWNKAGLPQEYKSNINSFSFDVRHINRGEQIIEFDGKVTAQPGLVDFYLLQHKINDTVNIKSIVNHQIIERNAVLPEHYSNTDLIILIIVTLLYFFTGIFILIKYSSSNFAYIIHMLTVCTGIMVIFDWGDLLTYNKVINFILMAIYEISIFMVPTLFLHFSFNYPVSKSKVKLVVLVPFYFMSFVCIIISILNLTGIIFFNIDITKTYFLPFHTYIADIFLVIGLILTVAKLEHSALTMPDALSRKQIYWALLGISFGPLVYVFLILIPRLLLGFELVSVTFMDFTIIIAPIMLLISVSRKK
jgi:hypothetical protein